jgi:hypothetical protein
MSDDLTDFAGSLAVAGGWRAHHDVLLIVSLALLHLPSAKFWSRLNETFRGPISEAIGSG